MNATSFSLIPSPQWDGQGDLKNGVENEKL